jgi:hypothetical protein
MSENKISVFGLEGVYVRVGATEHKLEAAQNAEMSANINLEDLMGDNSLVPLDSQPKSMEIEVRGRHGKVALEVLDALIGGTQVQKTAGTFDGPDEENGGCSMKNAISGVAVDDATAMLTDTFSFAAVTASTYRVTKNSDGSSLGVFDCASYPRTDVVPGMTLTVNGTLEVGSWASVKTVAVGETLEISELAKSDFPSQVAVRVITEDLPGQGQLEIMFYRAQPAGISIPSQTKTFALVDFSFRVMYDSNVGKTMEIRKYTKPVSAC